MTPTEYEMYLTILNDIKNNQVTNDSGVNYEGRTTVNNSKSIQERVFQLKKSNINELINKAIINDNMRINKN